MKKMNGKTLGGPETPSPPPPQMTPLQFLMECVNFAAIRSRYFSTSPMKDVFENVDAQSVRFYKRNSLLSRIIISLFPFTNIS